MLVERVLGYQVVCGPVIAPQIGGDECVSQRGGQTKDGAGEQLEW